jgi:hypothetical protein
VLKKNRNGANLGHAAEVLVVCLRVREVGRGELRPGDPAIPILVTGDAQLLSPRPEGDADRLGPGAVRDAQLFADDRAILVEVPGSDRSVPVMVEDSVEARPEVTFMQTDDRFHDLSSLTVPDHDARPTGHPQPSFAPAPDNASA